MPARTEDLIRHVVDEKPAEFAQSFQDRIRDIISGKIAEKKYELAQNVFTPQVEPETAETEDDDTGAGDEGDSEESETVEDDDEPEPALTADETQHDGEDEQLDEKYIGFDKLKGKLAKKGIRNPGALAAKIGRKKYGSKKFNKAAAQGKKMKGMKAK